MKAGALMRNVMVWIATVMVLAGVFAPAPSVRKDTKQATQSEPGIAGRVWTHSGDVRGTGNLRRLSGEYFRADRMTQWRDEALGSPAVVHWFNLPFGAPEGDYDMDLKALGEERYRQFIEILPQVAAEKQTGFYVGVQAPRGTGLQTAWAGFQSLTPVVAACQGPRGPPIVGLDASSVSEQTNALVRQLKGLLAYRGIEADIMAEPWPSRPGVPDPSAAASYWLMQYQLWHVRSDKGWVKPHEGREARIVLLMNRWEVGRHVLESGQAPEGMHHWWQLTRERYLVECEWALRQGFTISIDLTEWRQSYGDFDSAYRELVGSDG